MCRRTIPAFWIIGVAVTAGAVAGLSGEPDGSIRRSHRGRADALESARDKLLEAADLLVDASNAGPSDSAGSKALRLSSEVGRLLDRVEVLCDDVRRTRGAGTVGPSWDGLTHPDRRWQVRESIMDKPEPLPLPPIPTTEPTG